jgi:hypothetical protein
MRDGSFFSPLSDDDKTNALGLGTLTSRSWLCANHTVVIPGVERAEPQALFDHGIHSFPAAFTLIDGCTL